MVEESSNKKQDINSLPVKIGFSKCLVTGQLKQSEKKQGYEREEWLRKECWKRECGSD